MSADLHEDEIFARTPEQLEAARERRTYGWMERERARREAVRRLDAEARGPVVPPTLDTLRDRLAHPQPAVRWRIQGWQPANSRVMLAAQFKGGKTTLVGNLSRSLVDGDPFLGRDLVTPLTGTLMHLDFEMSPRQSEDWYRALHIRHDDRIVLVSMRGRARAFDILDPAVRAEWAGRFRAQHAEYLILDCLRPVLDALGLDEHTDAGRFLVAFDALLAEAGIPDALVVQHMGHLNERARGDSRLRDWPDVEWRLVRQDDDPASARFLSAYGRDVDMPEAQLAYDPRTRALTLLGGSRADAKTAAALDAVLDVLRAEAAALSGRAIKAKMSDSEHARNTIDMALKIGRESGALRVEPGRQQAHLYRVGVSRCPEVSRECPEDTESECPAASIEAGHSDSHQPADDRVNSRDTQTPPFGMTAEVWARHRGAGHA